MSSARERWRLLGRELYREHRELARAQDRLVATLERDQGQPWELKARELETWLARSELVLTTMRERLEAFTRKEYRNATRKTKA